MNPKTSSLVILLLVVLMPAAEYKTKKIISNVFVLNQKWLPFKHAINVNGVDIYMRIVYVFNNRIHILNKSIRMYSIIVYVEDQRGSCK